MRKNILILTRHIKSASFRQRVTLYLNALTDAGIDHEIITLDRKSKNNLAVYKTAKKFDAVFLHKKRLNFAERFVLRRYAKKIIYDFDDAVMYDIKKPEKTNRKKIAKFSKTIKMIDTVIAGNQYLARQCGGHGNVKILPTGLDIKEYRTERTDPADNKIRLVWIGSGSNLKYLKNLSPVLEQLGKKHSNLMLRIICNEFIELENMCVEKITWSLQSQARDLAVCDIGLAPLPINRFTKGKCGFKILQYAAAGLPVIASPVGVNSEIVTESFNGFHAEDTQQWVEKISSLVENKPLRKKMGENNLQRVNEYDLGVLAEKFTKIISETINNQGG